MLVFLFLSFLASIFLHSMLMSDYFTLGCVTTQDTLPLSEDDSLSMVKIEFLGYFAASLKEWGECNSQLEPMIN